MTRASMKPMAPCLSSGSAAVPPELWAEPVGSAGALLIRSLWQYAHAFTSPFRLRCGPQTSGSALLDAAGRRSRRAPRPAARSVSSRRSSQYRRSSATPASQPIHMPRGGRAGSKPLLEIVSRVRPAEPASSQVVATSAQADGHPAAGLEVGDRPGLRVGREAAHGEAPAGLRLDAHGRAEPVRRSGRTRSARSRPAHGSSRCSTVGLLARRGEVGARGERAAFQVVDQVGDRPAPRRCAPRRDCPSRPGCPPRTAGATGSA